MAERVPELDTSYGLTSRIQPDQLDAIDRHQADFDLLMTQEQIDTVLSKKQ